MSKTRTHRAFHEIDRVATKHEGIITTAELHELDFTDNMINTLVLRGVLIRRYRGVYLVGHRAISRYAEWYAATCAAGPGAALTHASAGQFWGIDRSKVRRIEVVVPKRRRPRRGFTLMIDQDCERHRVVERGMPATSPLRTIRDLSGRYPPSRIAQVIKEAQHLELVTLAEVASEAARMRRGIPRTTLEEAIAIRRSGGQGSDSAFEDRVREFLRQFDIPMPTPNVWVVLPDGRRVRVDLDWGDLDVIGEADGTHTHRTREQQAEDRRRDRDLAALGKPVFRIHEEAFDRDPHAAVAPLVAAVRGAVAARDARISAVNRAS